MSRHGLKVESHWQMSEQLSPMFLSQTPRMPGARRSVRYGSRSHHMGSYYELTRFEPLDDVVSRFQLGLNATNPSWITDFMNENPDPHGPPNSSLRKVHRRQSTMGTFGTSSRNLSVHWGHPSVQTSAPLHEVTMNEHRRHRVEVIQQRKQRLRNEDLRRQMQTSHRFALRDRLDKDRIAIPGPGKYLGQVDTIGQDAPAIKFSQATPRPFQPETSPGPGSYDISGGIDSIQQQPSRLGAVTLRSEVPRFSDSTKSKRRVPDADIGDEFRGPGRYDVPDGGSAFRMWSGRYVGQPSPSHLDKFGRQNRLHMVDGRASSAFVSSPRRLRLGKERALDDMPHLGPGAYDLPLDTFGFYKSWRLSSQRAGGSGPDAQSQNPPTAASPAKGSTGALRSPASTSDEVADSLEAYQEQIDLRKRLYTPSGTPRLRCLDNVQPAELALMERQRQAALAAAEEEKQARVQKQANLEAEIRRLALVAAASQAEEDRKLAKPKRRLQFAQEVDDGGVLEQTALDQVSNDGSQASEFDQDVGLILHPPTRRRKRRISRSARRLAEDKAVARAAVLATRQKAIAAVHRSSRKGFNSGAPRFT